MTRRLLQCLICIFYLSVITTTGCSGSGGEAASDTESTVTVYPTEIDDLLANPGMGWQTFHRYADNDANLAGLPSGSAYFRFKWQKLEPTDGAINVEQVATVLQRARTAGQTLMIRVATAGSDESYTPTWLEAAGCKVFHHFYKGNSLIAPDLDDPVCWTRYEALMTALGERLGNETDLQVDIGGVGLWGEWHFSSTEPRVPLPSLETRQKVVDLHRTLFPNVPHQALINNVEALAYATEQGSGWRADCLGDWGVFSSTWNHMEDMYRQHVEEAQATEAWKNGPVAWESCSTMQDWVDAGYDVHATFEMVLELHGSMVNNKSAAIPDGSSSRAEVEWLLKRLGYRLVLHALTFPKAVNPGSLLALEMSWENAGVAPPYHPFGLKFRLTPPVGSGASEVLLDGSADLRSWLPGSHEVTESLPLPSTMTPGAWALAVAISGTPGIPMLRLAIEGRDEAGWYPMGTIQVE